MNQTWTKTSRWRLAVARPWTALCSVTAAVQRLLEMGKYDVAQNKCEKSGATNPASDPPLREICAKAFWPMAESENSHSGWVTYQRTWVGTTLAPEAASIRLIPAPNTAEKSRKFFDEMNSWAQSEGFPGLGYATQKDGVFGGPIAKNHGEAVAVAEAAKKSQAEAGKTAQTEGAKVVETVKAEAVKAADTAQAAAQTVQK